MIAVVAMFLQQNCGLDRPGAAAVLAAADHLELPRRSGMGGVIFGMVAIATRMYRESIGYRAVIIATAHIE